MNTETMFSSKTDMWETPKHFFEKLNRIYRFDIDVCAVPQNAKCAKFYTPEEDGLKQEWKGHCWCNPPYGRDVGKWVKKARDSAENGATVVMLLPARTDTAWFHDYIMHGGVPTSICFVRDRIKFGNAKNNAPFPSIVVTFNPKEVDVS